MDMRPDAVIYRIFDTAASGPHRRMLPLRVVLDVEHFRPPHMCVFFFRPQDHRSAWGWFDLTTN